MRRDAGADRVADPFSFKAADVAAHAHSDILSTPYGPADVVTFLAAVVLSVAPADACADRGPQRRTDALSDDVAAIVAADARSVRTADDGRTDWTSNNAAPDAAALERTVARA